LDSNKVEQIASNMSIENKTLAKEIVIEKTKEDELMK
jgi:hypothetical protein